MPIPLAKALLKSARFVHPDRGLRDAVWRVKYCLRGLAQARLTREWFSVLQMPQLRALSHANPHVLSKLQRPYLHRDLSPRRRLEALRCHYSFVARHLSDQMRGQIYGPRGFQLASVPLEKAGRVELWLVYRHSSGKEGDLTILLEEQESLSPVCCLTFSLVADDDSRREVFIGGLQGFSLAHHDGRVVSITRAMHGLRPKALVVFALRQLVSVWGCSQLRAVSDAMHIYRHYQRRKDFAAQYDEFWQECGARRNADGMFDLPLAQISRPLSDIKANKRSMYRQRYALLGEIGAEICARTQSHYLKDSFGEGLNCPDSARPSPLRPTCLSVGT